MKFNNPTDNWVYRGNSSNFSANQETPGKEKWTELARNPAIQKLKIRA